ncbi:hypothetical protein P0Y35_15765 [Kiritimatiellaeota bacterium B1221]|nr:hypothetical protein [Kiritimatiellaeota bacterium B1221]
MRKTMVLAFFCMISAWRLHAGEIGIVARAGEPMPDGQGVFGRGYSDFTAPVLSEDGLVLFHVDVDDTEGFSIYALMVGVPGSTVAVGRRLQSPAVLTGIGDGHFDRFYQGAIAESGVAGFVVKTESNGHTYALMNAGSETTDYVLHAVNGQSSPDEGALVIGSGLKYNMNACGDIAFYTGLTQTNGGGNDDAAIFRAESGSSVLTAIAQNGDAMPSGVGTYDILDGAPGMDDAGQVFFLVSVDGNASPFDEALLRGNGNSLALMIASGAVLPGGDVITDFSTTSEVAVNRAGQVAVPANYVGNNSADVILNVTAPETFSVVAREGQLISGTAYLFSTFSSYLDLNDNGQTLFAASMVLAAGGGASAGIFQDGQLIAQNGSLIPAGDGVFHGLEYGPFAQNNAGDIAFECNILTEGDNLHALFFYQAGSGVTEVIREGAALAGGTLESFEFLGTSSAGVLPSERNGLNDKGQVAFKYRLVSGEEGIAIWGTEASLVAGLPRPQIRQEAPDQVVATFSGLPGVPYRIETSLSLTDPDWIPVSAFSFVDEDWEKSETFSTDQTRFIRMSAVR